MSVASPQQGWLHPIAHGTGNSLCLFMRAEVNLKTCAQRDRQRDNSMEQMSKSSPCTHDCLRPNWYSGRRLKAYIETAQAPFNQFNQSNG